MTSLFAKTGKYYIGFSVLVFLIGGFVLFYEIRSIINDELTENLYNEKNNIENTLKKDTGFEALIIYYGNRFKIKQVQSGEIVNESLSDTVLYDEIEGEYLGFRQIVFPVKSDDKLYEVTIRKSLIESDDIMEGIAISIALLFALFMVTLYLLNLWLSRKLWKPFNQTLHQLKSYDIQKCNDLTLEKTNIKEFHELNSVLETMNQKLLDDFKNMKEFTENASHEIQTPLSIINNRLEILIQSEALTEQQFSDIQVIYESAKRLSKLNQSLLLLTKIDNNQFADKEEVELSEIIHKYLAVCDDIIKKKNIKTEIIINCKKTIKINSFLIETMFSNLIINSIRHNVKNGQIKIEMTEKQCIVSNTGNLLSGNPSEYFNRFKKAGNSSDSLGLGLSIVKKISDHYNWSVAYTLLNEWHLITITF